MAAQGGQPAAGQKTAEEQAAEAKAAAESAAAEKAAVEKAAADAAAAAKPEIKPKGYTVIGAATVMRAEDGSERYLYKGAPFDGAAFSKDSVKHNLSVGLIEKAK